MKTIHRTILSTMFIGSACSEFPDVEDLLPQDTHGQTSQNPPGDWPELSTTHAETTDWPDSGSGSTTGDPSIDDPSNPTTPDESVSESLAETDDSTPTTSQETEDPEDTEGNEDTGDSSSTTSDDSGDEFDACQFLQISEFMANPEGKDGSAEGPEWVEIRNRSASNVSLHGCVLESRSWPAIDLETLDTQTDELKAGQRLTIYRFNKSVLAPNLPSSTSDRIDIAFYHNSGLRNIDGAIGIRDVQGNWADLVVYGGPAVAPFDDPKAWEGAATSSPTSGQTLCRSANALDNNAASDWYTCPPSPGQANPDLEGDENPADDDSDSSTTGTTEESEGADASDDHSDETESSEETSQTGEQSTGDEPSNETDTDTDTDTNTADSGDDEATGDSDTEDQDDAEDPASPSIVISTVLSNPVGPASEDKFHEYVDIVNIGSEEVLLQGWTIADDLDIDAKGMDPILYRSGTGGCRSEDLCLAPGRSARIAGSEYIQSEADPDLLILQTDDTTIADGGMTALEAIVLRDSTSAIRSTYRSWPDPKADPNPSQTESAIARIELDGADTMENWQFVSPSEPQRRRSVIPTTVN